MNASSQTFSAPIWIRIGALALIFLGLGTAAVRAEPRAASMVIDANTGAVLHNSSGDEPVYPASLTKMMTLYMAFELIELGRLRYDTKITMTPEGAAAAPSKLDLDPGQEIAVIDAIKALVTKSANDVAIALAQHIGGTEANFARLMTRKARELGMRNTTFRNASGLPDPEQRTTARDMITLGLALQDDFPRQYRLFATRSFSYGGKVYRNHNSLLARYAGTDGIKTGYTRASGFNLVSSAHRDGKHLVAAVFGGKTARVRNARMQSILTAAWSKASTQKTRRLIARAPQPQPATAPRPVAAAQPPAPPPRAAPPSPPREPLAAIRPTAQEIAVARVRPVRIDDAVAARGAGKPQAAPPPRFAVAASVPRFVPETGALPSGPGRAPSTLGAQAARLDIRVAAAPPPAVPPRGSSPQGPFAIQIGAFGNSAEAERRMTSARQKVGGMLDPYHAVAVPVESGGSRLYRARFRGFDATAANATCSRLRSLAIDCFVVRAE